MKSLTQIVLVGHTKERLIDGIRQFPIEKIILVLGENPKLEGEEKVIEVANVVEAVFKEIAMVKKIYVNKEDIFLSAQKILEIIIKEAKEGREIMINISGSLRQMAIACYIAALVSNIPIYSAIPKYDHDFKEIGVSEICQVPFFPIKEITGIKMDILKILEKEEKIESIDMLIKKIYSTILGDTYNRFRAKISYYLKELEEEGFIQKKRIGKKVNIDLTQTGKIYILGRTITELKKT